MDSSSSLLSSEDLPCSRRISDSHTSLSSAAKPSTVSGIRGGGGASEVLELRAEAEADGVVPLGERNDDDEEAPSGSARGPLGDWRGLRKESLNGASFGIDDFALPTRSWCSRSLASQVSEGIGNDDADRDFFLSAGVEDILSYARHGLNGNHFTKQCSVFGGAVKCLCMRAMKPSLI